MLCKCTPAVGDPEFLIAVGILKLDEARQLPDGSWVYFDNDPDDRGGASAWGISRQIREWNKLTPEILGIADFSNDEIRKITWATAQEIYRRYYWDLMRLWRLNDQTIATKLLNLTVNISKRAVIRFAQQACLPEYPTLDVDGLIGPKTIEAINGCCRWRWLREFGTLAATHYRQQAAIPGQAKWLPRWLRRAEWGVPEGPHP